MNYISRVNEKEYIKEVLSRQPFGKMLITYLEDWIEEKEWDIAAMHTEPEFFDPSCWLLAELQLKVIEKYLHVLVADTFCWIDEDTYEDYDEPYSEYESVLPKRQAMRPKTKEPLEPEYALSKAYYKARARFKRFILGHQNKSINTLYAKFKRITKNKKKYEYRVMEYLWNQDVNPAYKYSRGEFVPTAYWNPYALKKYAPVSLQVAKYIFPYTPTWKEREYAKLYRRAVTMPDGVKFSYDYTPYKAKGKKGIDKYCFDGNWNKTVEIRYWHGTVDRKKTATKKEIKKYKLNEISANFEPTIYDRKIK